MLQVIPRWMMAMGGVRLPASRAIHGGRQPNVIPVPANDMYTVFVAAPFA